VLPAFLLDPPEFRDGGEVPGVAKSQTRIISATRDGEEAFAGSLNWEAI
jgi:hypothetical protein